MRGERSQSLLVISDGGVASLVACLLNDQPEQVSAWVPPPGAGSIDSPAVPIGQEHRESAREQAELLGLRTLVVSGAVTLGTDRQSKTSGADVLPTPVVLMLAMQEAARVGCDIVLWPVVCGADLDDLVGVAETARLVTRLADLPGRAGSTDSNRLAGSLRMETPLADLSVEQVAALALDLDAPTHLCWWNRVGAGAPAGAIEARATWESALKAAATARGYVPGAAVGSA